MRSCLWLLLLNQPIQSAYLEEKGQQELYQYPKCPMMVGRKGILIPPDNISNVWALRISAEHFPAAPHGSNTKVVVLSLYWLP